MADGQAEAARRVFEALAPALAAPVGIRLWDGSRVSLAGEGAPEPELEIAIAGPGVLGSLLRRPTLDTLVKLYTAGRIDVRGGDLLRLVDALRAHRGRSLRSVSKWDVARRALPLLFARGSAAAVPSASPRGSGAAAIEFHYDLGSEFYALFLDPEMQYSCAYFEDWEGPLAQAQLDKLEMICRKLRLAKGERLLDVGCGWGGLVCHAAQHYGVEAVGITLSRAQLEYAREKVRVLGLEGRVAVELRDVADLDPADVGRFDKIASIGMVEHVGIANHPAYFEKLAVLLRDRGLLLNHGITRGAKKSRRAFRRMRPEKRLMLRYVFPGHELDHLGHTVEGMEAHGFEVRDVEDWREHYALTTRHWCRRLDAATERAEALVGRSRHRTWLAYLAGVSTAFADGSLRVYQVLASRHAGKGPSELPPTRADLYQRRASLR